MKNLRFVIGATLFLMYKSMVVAAPPAKDWIQLKSEVRSMQNGFVEIQNMVKNQNELVKAEKETVSINFSKVNEKQRHIESEIAILKNIISRTEKESERNAQTNQWAAIILLLGLLFEIIGATFLSSEVLTNEIDIVRNLHPVEMVFDLGTENVALKPIVTFLTYFGAFLILLGFLIQTVGTFLILDISLFWMATILMAMAAVAIWVSYFVAGRSLEQTPKERFITLFENTKYAIIKGILYSFNKNPKCDGCGDPIKQDKQFIQLRIPKNTPHKPFANGPTDFNIGHYDCLKLIVERKAQKVNTGEQQFNVAAGIEIYERDKFLTWAETMDAFHDGWRAHWAGVRGKDLGEGSWFKNLKRIKARLN